MSVNAKSIYTILKSLLKLKLGNVNIALSKEKKLLSSLKRKVHLNFWILTRHYFTILLFFFKKSLHFRFHIFFYLSFLLAIKLKQIQTLIV